MGPDGTWDARLPVRAFFTSRRGGMSRSPYDTLNLAQHTGDSPGSVAHNRTKVEALAGARVVYMSQVHGSGVAVVSYAGPGPEADALLTGTPKVGVAVLAADCVPVLLYDSGSNGVAAVHAGRAGVVEDVVGAAVAGLRRLGGERTGSIAAVMGPAICGACYEVPAEMRDAVATLVPASAATTSWGTPSLDLPAAVGAQLRAAGVEAITAVGPCTYETRDLYSHRRDGVTGRFAGVIVCPA